MTLQELIKKLESMDPNDVIKPGFGEGGSWRGSYDEIAFAPTQSSTVKSMLKCARDMVGSQHYGYKGGLYTYDMHTPCNVADYGVYNGDSDRMDIWWAVNVDAKHEVARLMRENTELRRKLALLQTEEGK